MKYSIENHKVSESLEITSILATIGLSEGKYIEVGVMSWGAGIRRISYIDTEKNITKDLTLSYKNIAESCHNDSLAGLTIGPNSGRLNVYENVVLKDGDQELILDLPANEDGYKQIHGGVHNLAMRNWEFCGVVEYDEGIEVTFRTEQEDGLDGWPGNRKYEIKYIIGDGLVKINLQGSTDSLTYINMTNHTYWIREGLQLEINSNKMIKNKKDFLPEEILNLPSKYKVDESSILNNAFILEDNTAATMCYKDIPLNISLSTDAPAVVVYTGDYLDELSGKASAIALEPQELYPFTQTTLSDAHSIYSRNIALVFK